MTGRTLQANAVAALFATLLLWAGVPAEAPVADAAQRGDVESVRSLLRSGADVNAAHGDGMTALHWAAEAGHAELAEMLLYAGANHGAVTRLGDYTPLHLAARGGRADVTVLLIEAGADVGTGTSTGGVQPLHFAARSGDPGTIAALLEAGADPNATESLSLIHI